MARTWVALMALVPVLLFVSSSGAAPVAGAAPVVAAGSAGGGAGAAVPTVATNAADVELRLILLADDAAQDQMLRWTEEASAPTNAAAAPLKLTLPQRLQAKAEEVKKLYGGFLERYPNHAGGHLAYGSFLGDIDDEDGMQEHWEKARELDPSNPAAWNNLAGHYAHRGPIRKAFTYFEKAIELRPREPLYYHSLGTCVFLFRKDAREYWNIDEQRVFAKSLELYSHAFRLDATNFVLATDIAQTYYGITAPSEASAQVKAAHEVKLIGDALGAWTNALALAGGPVEREGTLVHIARWKIRQGRFDEAREVLGQLQLPAYGEIRKRLERNIRDKEAGGGRAPARP